MAGGAAGSLPYQTGANATTFLAAGTNGQVLTLASGIPSWATPTTGTVTSVSGTGTVNGLTLTGTVTTSGSLTLGGTLSNIANSALTNSSITFGSTAAALGTTVSALNGVSIGATTRSSGDFTTLSGNSVTSTTPVLSFNASNTIASFGSSTASSYNQLVIQNKSTSAGASTNYVASNDLGTDSTYYGEFGMNSSTFSSGTPADFFSINNGIYFSGHDGAITVGSGNGQNLYLAWGSTGQSAHVINSSGAIGLNTNITGTTNFGTTGQVLTSAGSGAAPSWTTISAGLTVTDDTSTNATRYLTFTSATSGTISAINTSSTELKWNPSLGILDFSGAVGAINLPSGTTAQRPASPVAGATRYNTTLNQTEIYSGTSWTSITSQTYSVLALIVAGGGGGGFGGYGGGGGAGGLIYQSAVTLTQTTAYTITIGAGGAGNPGSGNNGAGTAGSNSSALTYTAIGGGAGSGQISAINGAPTSGGSGGGGTALGVTTGASGTSGQGNAGGNGSLANSQGGGGGGAGAAGSTPAGGSGAAYSISGTSTYYAGGGAGNNASNTQTGSNGGGGSSGISNSNGTANTGGGGGSQANSVAAGTGGSGIVIISYLGSQRDTGGTVTSSGGYTIHTFTSSGTYTA